jgi:hypothetical protein
MCGEIRGFMLLLQRGEAGDAVIKPPARVGSPCGPSGICISGDVNFDTGKVNKYVKGVRIGGFTVKNFKDQGIFAIGARDAVFADNRLIGNGEYGIFALFSTGTKSQNVF